VFQPSLEADGKRQVVGTVRIVGKPFHGTAEQNLGPWVVTPLQGDHPEVVQRLGKGRISLRGPPEEVGRLFVLSPVEGDQPQVVQQPRVIGRFLEGLAADPVDPVQVPTLEEGLGQGEQPVEVLERSQAEIPFSLEARGKTGEPGTAQHSGEGKKEKPQEPVSHPLTCRRFSARRRPWR